jgi:hypothetical protein
MGTHGYGIVSSLGVGDLSALDITVNLRDLSNQAAVDSVNPPDPLSYFITVNLSTRKRGTIGYGEV